VDYRTTEQFDKICNSAINGNWSVAFKECAEYGFYANDLINKFEESDGMSGLEATDLAILAEGASDFRHEELNN